MREARKCMISGDPWAFDPQRYGAATAADTLVKGMKLDGPGFEPALVGKTKLLPAYKCRRKRERFCNIHSVAK